MPTVILVDISAPMGTPFTGSEFDNRLEFSIHGLCTLLEYIGTNSRLEFVSIMSFSSAYGLVVPFTRDVGLMKMKLSQVKPSNDQADLDQALEGAEKTITSEWGSGLMCNVILVTHESPDLKAKVEIPFSFPGNLIVVTPAHPSVSMVQMLDDKDYSVKFYAPQSPVNYASTVNTFQNLCEEYYAAWVGQLVCGHFNSKVTLSPSPLPYTKETDFDSCNYTVENTLEICGFIELQHLGSPSAVSRHLVFPYPSINIGFPAPPSSEEGRHDSDEEMYDEGQLPSFCVLLHGALKVENMAALCSVGQDWYGVLYSWADSKKKSNLMLSLLEPGHDSVPWLGDLNNLTISSDVQAESFPVKPAEKRSYSQNCIAWIRQPGLQSDIQKIIRHARKIPDKTQQFYKELNRVRRAAICLGFISLIEELAIILERECTLLPGGAHPACAFQLTHAASVLRQPYSRDPKYNIMPMKMSFD